MKNFKIPKKPITRTKSIRFPNDVIKNVEKVINGNDCTFSAFVVEAVKAVLNEIK